MGEEFISITHAKKHSLESSASCTSYFSGLREQGGWAGRRKPILAKCRRDWRKH